MSTHERYVTRSDVTLWLGEASYRISDDGSVVTVDGGYPLSVVSIYADDPATLRALADALRSAADRLAEAIRSGEVRP